VPLGNKLLGFHDFKQNSVDQMKEAETMDLPKVVSQEERLAARRRHLNKDKEFTRLRRDEAQLPWTMVWLRHHDRYDDEPKRSEV
jgi:hypothetical protein